MLFSKLFILVLVGTLHFSIAQSSSGDDETQAVGNAETHENRWKNTLLVYIAFTDNS